MNLFRHPLSPIRIAISIASFAAFLAIPVSSFALPADFSPPGRALGYADREGYVQWHLKIREIDFGDGLKIPFRFSFNSKNETSPYGWAGFHLGAIESSAIQKSPTLYLLTFLCSKQLWFKRNPNNQNEYFSTDKQWTMTSTGGSTLKAVRWDGWELTFKNGLIDTVKTDKGRTLKWERDAAAQDRVKRIYEPATNINALEMVYAAGNAVTGIKINGDLYEFIIDGTSLNQITLPDGRTHSFQHTGTAIEHTDTFGVKTTWTWDTANKQITGAGPWTYVTGSAVPSEEDGIVYNRPKLERQRTANASEEESVEYTAQNSIIERKEFNGLTRKTYRFMTSGRLYGKTYKIEDVWLSGTSVVYQAEYDEQNGRMQREFDALNRETAYGYQDFPEANEFQGPRLIRTIDPLGQVRIEEFDVEGNLIKTTEYGVVPRSYEHDSRGRMTKIIESGTNVIREMTYNNNDAPLTITDQSGNVTTFAYQEHHGESLLTKITSPEGRVAEFEYDSKANRIKTKRDMNGDGTAETVVTTSTFNSLNRLTQVKDALNRQTDFTYDADANVTGINDALNQDTIFDYDDLDNVDQIVTALSGTSKYNWSAGGLLKDLRDHRDKAYTFAYHKDNQRLEMQWPDSVKQERTYDAEGNLTTYKPRAGDAVINYSYDNGDRLTGYTWQHGVGITGSGSFSYDAANRTTWDSAIANGVSVSHGYGYDSKGRLNSVSQTAPGAGTRTATMEWCECGSLDSLTYPAGFKIIYERNDDGQITAIKKLEGGTTVTLASYEYDDAARLSTRTLANGVVTSYTSDAVDNVTSIVVTKSGSTPVILWSNTYGYDDLNRRTFTQLADGKGDAYRYDATSQVAGVRYSGSNPQDGYLGIEAPATEATWDFDIAGNRTAQVINSATTTYAVNDINQYLTVDSGSLTYNSRGDLVFGHPGLGTLSYDAFGHLISATGTSGQLHKYFYDSGGTRVGKQLHGEDAVFSFHVGFDRIEDFDTETTGVTSYIYEPGIDRPLAMVDDAGEVFFFHQDVLGNVVGLTNEGGTITQQYRYEVWGKPSVYDSSYNPQPSSLASSPFLFTAREYDHETGLYHYRARAYSPELGRFMQFDPIDFASADRNLTMYVRNQPAFATDPLGKASFKVAQCEIKIVYGHGGTKPHEFQFDHPECSGAGFTGCYNGYTNEKIPPGSLVPGAPNSKKLQDDKQNWKDVENMVAGAKVMAKKLCSAQCCKQVKITLEHTPSGNILTDAADAMLGNTGWEKKLNETITCP